MNKPPVNILPLGPLLELLKSGGYELSIQQVLEIQSILLNTPLIESGTDNLKFILTPLIAKNEEEQNSIYKIVDDWVAVQTKKVIRPPHPLRVWMAKHTRLVLALKIAGFLLVIATGLLFYFFAGRKNPSARRDRATIPQTTTANKAGTSPAKPPAATSTTPASSTVLLPPKPKTVTSDPGRYERPIVPQPIESSLVMSLIFGFIGGAILYHLIFYERKRKLELEKRRRAEEAIFVAPEEEEKLTVGREQTKTESYEQVILEFPSSEYLVQKSSLFAAIKNDLKKPAPVEHPAYDIKKSIQSTIRNAGFRTVKYAPEWKARKYIIIIDNSNPDAHITQLMNYFVEWFRAAIAPVVHYTYSFEITQLRDSNNKVQFLEELAQRTADHDLVIVGYAHSFFNELDQRPREKVIDVFSRWSSRSLITPVPLADWWGMEAHLKEQNFNIVPAEADAIALLARTIAGGENINDELLTKTVIDSYSVSLYNFQSVQGLKEYLYNDALFQLVCSLAVYPTLNWGLTLALLDAVIKSDAAKYADTTMSYELLLKVARIPWLHQQRLPDDVRLQLLESTDPATEIIARETIVRLLDEVRHNTPKGSGAFKELREQYNLNAFLLYSHNKETYKDYSASREVITHYWNNLEDKALKDLVNNQANNLLPVNREGKHKTVEEFVMEDEEFDKYNVNLLKVSLLVLPAFILYIAFNIIKPGFVYPAGEYRNVSVAAIIEKTDTCAQKLTHATVMKNGMSSRHNLKSGSQYDTIVVPDIAYTDAGEYYDLELWTGDKRVRSFSVLAKDSFFIVPVRCGE